jgi:hypothetical protein
MRDVTTVEQDATAVGRSEAAADVSPKWSTGQTSVHQD